MSVDTAVSEAGRDPRPAAMVRVWDPLVRIFHWSLVMLFALAFVTGDEWKSVHVTTGYLIAGLVAFRVLWGVVGPKSARFASFVRGPAATLGYVRHMLAFKAPRYLGHNPAGGAMIVALLTTIALIAATGYMMTTDAFWGVEWVEDLHESMVYVTLGLIALHVGGVVLASIEHRENLVRSMFTGLKRRT
jgi:cytochrome b